MYLSKNKLPLAFSLILIALILSVRQAEAQPWYGCAKNSSTGKKILFVGHSKFYWHDMPKMLADLLQKTPAKVSYVFGNSYSIQDHWNHKLALKVIRSERPKWDYVVFIERTGRPQEAPELFEKYICLFDKEVKRIGGKTILVESYTDDVKDYPARHETMMEWSKKLNLPVIPVATAWNTVRKKYPWIKLYAKDGHHPSIQGTYLMSCMFYSYLLKKSPAELPGRLNYSDKLTGSSIVFKSQIDLRNVQSAAYNAINSM